MSGKNLFITLILAAWACWQPAMAEESLSMAGAVFAMNNAADGNAIVVYDRLADGRLQFKTEVETQGLGSGGEEPLEPVDALGSQNPVVLTSDQRWLLAVNAGSNEVSVFRVTGSDLELTDVEPSGGDFPVSISVHNRLVYVLNSGGEGNFTGFELDQMGKLNPIANSTRSLNVGGNLPPRFIVSPAQIGINPWGDLLFVTIKGSNEIRAYTLNAAGVPSATAISNTSNGSTPFGFSFDRHGNLLVVEPFGNADTIPTAMASSVSSYYVDADGTLHTISATVENMQTASCWIARTLNGHFAYTTNNASNTITGYRVAADGSLSLLNPMDGITAQTDENPVDLAISHNGRFLYAVNAGSGTIRAYAINGSTGSLTDLGSVDGLPVHDGAVGIAVK